MRDMIYVYTNRSSICETLVESSLHMCDMTQSCHASGVYSLSHVTRYSSLKMWETVKEASWRWGFDPVYTLLFDLYYELGTHVLSRCVSLMGEMGSISAGFQWMGLKPARSQCTPAFAHTNPARHWTNTIQLHANTPSHQPNAPTPTHTRITHYRSDHISMQRHITNSCICDITHTHSARRHSHTCTQRHSTCTIHQHPPTPTHTQIKHYRSNHISI